MFEDKDVSKDNEKLNPEDVIAAAKLASDEAKFNFSTEEEFRASFWEAILDYFRQVTVENIKTKGLADHYEHKKYWSYFLMFLISALLTCEYILLFGVGTGFFDFLDYQWLLPTLLLQTLLQIFALAVIVVKSLFSEKTG